MLARIRQYRLTQTRQIMAVCLAILAGIVLAYIRPAPAAAWLVWLGCGAVIGLRRRWVLLICILLASVYLGWWRGTITQNQIAPYTALNKQKVILVGRSMEDGVYGSRYQMQFTLGSVQVLQPYAIRVPGTISVKGFGAPAVYRGDTVKVTGTLTQTRGNNQAGVSFATLEVLESKPGILDQLRQKFAAGLLSALPEPLASFVLGLLIGQRSTLPPEVAQTLLIVGLTHIIAVSGYNLTIIVQVVRRALAKRSKFQTAAGCLLLIGVFMIITGSSPSIVRASIISVLSIGAWYYGRAIKPLVLLLAAAVITGFANPLYVWGNVSWYLSFLAFFGVLVISPLVMRRLFGDKQPRLFIQIILESLCAEIMTVPYILYIFGQVSTVSILANLLVAALVPLAMLLGLVAGLAGMLVPAIAGWFAWPAKLLLTYMLNISEMLSRIPHAFIENIGFSAPYLTATYAIVLVLVTALRRGGKDKHAIITEKN